MIKAEDRKSGTMVSIEGDTVDIISELTGIIMSVYEALENRYDEDFAKETIAMCGKLAFAEDASVKEEIIDNATKALVALEKGESR